MIFANSIKENMYRENVLYLYPYFLDCVLHLDDPSEGVKILCEHLGYKEDEYKIGV